MASSTLGGTVNDIARGHVLPPVREGRVSKVLADRLEVVVRSLNGDVQTLAARGWHPQIEDTDDGPVLISPKRGDRVWVADDEGRALVVVTWQRLGPSASTDLASGDTVRKWFPAPTADDTASMQAEINALAAAGGGELQLRRGAYSVSALDLSGKDSITIRGAGIGATSLAIMSATGHAINLSDASFCEFSDMLIMNVTHRTAGDLFYLDHAGGTCQRNSFRRLSLFSVFRGWTLDDCSTTTIEDVQVGDLNATWGWDSIIYCQGAAISTIVNRLRGGTEAGMANGFCRLASGPRDTFHASQWDVLSLGSATGTLGVIIDDGTWAKFTDCSIESGDQVAVTINGGVGIDFDGAHLLGFYGVNVSGGDGVRFRGGEIVRSVVHAINLAGGTDYKITGMTIHDIGEGYNGINIVGGVSDFTITDNDIGRAVLGVTQPGNGIQVQAGASDRYIIAGNRCRNFTGAGVVDGGTGVNKVVANNVSVA